MNASGPWTETAPNQYGAKLEAMNKHTCFCPVCGVDVFTLRFMDVLDGNFEVINSAAICTCNAVLTLDAE